MSLEIERKFLVDSFWNPPAHGGATFRQAYLPQPPGVPGETRVRIARHPDGRKEAWLTCKGMGDLIRLEEESRISLGEAERLMQEAVGNVIEKVRYTLPLKDGLAIEVDVYGGSLEGLVMAEVELPRPNTPIALPDWVGEEITQDKAYKNKNKNKNLALHGLPPHISPSLEAPRPS